MGATKIMIIRHAEKPGSYDLGTYATGVFGGVDGNGDSSKKCLVTMGWERAGGLVTLFVPPWGPKTPSLEVPDHIFASDPNEKESVETDDDKGHDVPSQRPFETLTAVADALHQKIHHHHSSDHYHAMVAEALACDGVVLIAWQHQDIPWTNKNTGKAGISQQIFSQTETPIDRFKIPTKWPGNATISFGSSIDLTVTAPSQDSAKFPNVFLPGTRMPTSAHRTPVAVRRMRK